MFMRTTLAVAACAMFLSTTARAETKVTVSEMHLCCGACVKAVQKAVGEVEGASVTVDRKAGSSAITADSKETAAKAVKALADAGFHGKTDNEELAMPDDSGAPEGKVARIELAGIHNCCGGCNKAIKAALGTVEGVAGDNADPKAETLVVEGDFVAKELIAALNKAGFHAKVKKEK